jgi:hypothetical protein
MKVYARIITDPRVLSENEDELDAFLKEYSPNPFMLLPFLRNLMSQNGWANQTPATRGVNQTPAIIVVRAEGRIIGLAPLILKRYLGIPYAEFLSEHWTSPDFVLRKNYESIAMETMIRLVLGRLNAKSVVLDLNSDSPNLPALRSLCKLDAIPFFEHSHQFMDHGVISVDRSWDDYRRSCGTGFAKELRSIRNKLDREGEWKVTVVANYDECSEEALYEKIMAIEKLSWKETHRRLSGQTVDESIKWFLMSSSSTKDNSKVLGRKVWFLELDGRPAAYSMLFQFKGVAYFMKMSFVEEYRRLGLGKFVNSAAIKDLFDKKEVQEIDFMTYLPMMRFWRVGCMKRVRIRLGNRGIVYLAYARSTLREATTRLNRDNERTYYAPAARSQLAEVGRRCISRPP